MNRLQELTLGWLDGSLSATEVDDLDRLLADPAARAEHRALCELEHALRCRAPGLDLTARVMQTLAADAQASGPLPRGVRPGPAGFRLMPGRRALRLAASFALLATVGWGLLLGARLWRRHGSGSARSDEPRLVHIEGDVQLTVDGRTGQAAANQALLPGTVVTAAADGLAVAELGDGSRITLHRQSRLSLPPAAPAAGVPGHVQRLHLHGGTLTAHVSARPPGQHLSIDTPAAGITVLGTRFVLTAEEVTTRLDVIQGTVGLLRRVDSARLEVPPLSYAVAGSTAGAACLAQQAAPRTLEGLLALYTFREAGAGLVRDVSGVAPPLDLCIATPAAVTWRPGGGLILHQAALIASSEPAAKISAACRRSGGITLEAWITPATLRQWGPARIVTLSQDPSFRNLTLGMGGPTDPGPRGGGRYSGRVRTSALGRNGLPAIETAPGSALADLTHLVLTRAADGTTRLYLDAVVRAEAVTPGDLSTWDEDYRLALGNEFGDDRKWFGTLHLLAVYSRALAAEEVSVNFRAGPDGGS